MYPNFITSKIIGIFPYKIKTLSFETSKPLFILWTIILFVFCVYGLTLLYEYNLPEFKLEETKIISYTFSLIYGIFVIVISYILNGPRMYLLQTILNISSKLSQQSYRKLSKLIHAKDIFGFSFVLGIGLIYTIHQNIYHNIYKIPYEPFRTYITILAFQMDMLYINCVCVLKACFKEINDNLENLRDLMMNNIPKWICHKQRYPLLLIKLKALKKEHLMISNAIQMLNVIFSPQLLGTVMSYFMFIIFDVYFQLIQWQDGISFNLNKIYNGYFISFMLYYFTNMILIVWTCETCKNQTTKICTTVHDMLNNANNMQINNELHLFSLQIFHCRSIFSVKGLTVDATLLTVVSDQICILINNVYIIYINCFLDGK
ncbi:uncharacterized protein LOC105834681 [Monomorium pharaonis]|uniref:uncharacterized protein LOC105834681 n=1 Tax=Monomorium pharaonis TaxID=307658 RepID=UPI00102E1B02|nr:uncharacterized protein LOC105834681 [Monomorium pharaonis]